MARGDVVAANNATAGSGTYTIQPSSGVEWVIHNIVVSGACHIQFYNGTTAVIIESPTGAASLVNYYLHINNTTYLQIVDTSGSTNNMHYDGVQTSA